MFSHKTEIEKADHLGEILVGGATETASIIIERLTAFAEGIRFRDSSTAPQFVIEVIVFYMHLVDRMAFAHFGAVKRETFGDRFIVAVVREFLQETSRELSADSLGKALRDTYNRRQIHYATYKVLVPKKDDPLKDTLYWEFSKILFGFLNDTNPATLMFLNLVVVDMTKIMVNDVLKVEEVLRS
jgi:hypothetical protein